MQMNEDRESPAKGVGRPKSGAMTRRGLMRAGAGLLGAGGVAAIGLGTSGVGGLGAQDNATPMATPEMGGAGDGFIEPPVLQSKDGFLSVKLEAAPDAAAGPGRMAYEQSIPGPTLRLRGGDQLNVALVNSLGGDSTNLHVHGMHVSPKDNGDNVFIHVEYGQTFNYSYALPESHPPGLYWYHPHSHGDSSQQVAAGLGGAIIVEGGLDDLPELAGLDRAAVRPPGAVSGTGSPGPIPRQWSDQPRDHHSPRRDPALADFERQRELVLQPATCPPHPPRDRHRR